MEKSTIALIGGIVVATVFAYAYGSRQGPAAPVPAPQPQDPVGMAQDPTVDPNATELPPGHPPIGDMAQQGSPHDMGTAVAPPSEDEPAALTWKAPASWTLAPSPNAMRLATYKLPGDAAELVVARAGGDVDGNVKRWAGQFDESYSLRETHKTVRGLKVTLVQLDGTYLGGMSGDAGAHAGWSMLAAIVETKGPSYFFKVVGPSTTVQGAVKPFEAMIDGVTPPS